MTKPDPHPDHDLYQRKKDSQGQWFGEIDAALENFIISVRHLLSKTPPFDPNNKSDQGLLEIIGFVQSSLECNEGIRPLVAGAMEEIESDIHCVEVEVTTDVPSGEDADPEKEMPLSEPPAEPPPPPPLPPPPKKPKRKR